MNETEEWKPVPGYPDTWASSLGRIAWVPKPFKTQSGHLRSRIRGADGKQHSTGVHHLVALAFHGENPPGTEACHNDGDPANNRPENLRFDTRHANMMDRVKHGTAPRGEKHYNTRLSDDDVRAIRRRSEVDGKLGTEIAAEFGIHPAYASQIIARKRRASVPDAARALAVGE